MLQPFTSHNETIYSFLFRLHTSFGLKSFRNIINPEGDWHDFPSALKETEFIYRFFNEEKLITLFNNAGLGLRNNGIYESPTHHLKILSVFFGNRAKYRQFKSSHERSNKIRYCQNCIQEQVKVFGTGFFKKEWQIDFECKIHNKQLNKINSYSYSQSEEAIKLVLKGKKPEGIIKVNETHIKTLENLDNELLNNHIYPFSPCLKGLFENWLNENFSLLPDRIIKNISLNSRKVSLNNYRNTNQIRYLCSTDKYKNMVYLHVMSHRYKTFEKLISEKTDLIKVFNGYFHKKSLFGYLYKSKNEDCQKCKIVNSDNSSFANCEANLLIYKTPKNIYAKNNICKLNFS